MFSAPGLPDLDALDPAALKAIILSQHDRFKAHHERYTATLTSRAGEIERLKLLVEKLQRMLFGAKSEKVLRQIEQLEFQLETCRPPTPSKKREPLLQNGVPPPPSRFAARCPSIFRARSTPIRPATKRVPTAAAG